MSGGCAGPPSLTVTSTRGEVVTTTTEQHSTTRDGTTNQGDDETAEAGTANRATADAWVPSPRRGDTSGQAEDGQDWSVRFHKDADGRVWMTVHGANLAQAAERLWAAGEALNRTQRPR